VDLARGAEGDGVSGAHPHPPGKRFSQAPAALASTGRAAAGAWRCLRPCGSLSSAGAALAAEPPCLWLPGGAEHGGPCLRAAEGARPAGSFAQGKVCEPSR